MNYQTCIAVLLILASVFSFFIFRSLYISKSLVDKKEALRIEKAKEGDIGRCIYIIYKSSVCLETIRLNLQALFSGSVTLNWEGNQAFRKPLVPIESNGLPSHPARKGK